MSAVLLLSALFVGFVGFSRFILGQLFFGDFDAATTLSGIVGLICANFALKMSSQRNWAPPATVSWACFIALAGVAMDAVVHYTQFDIPGNSYAWHIMGPYAACLVLFAYAAGRRRASSGTDA